MRPSRPLCTVWYYMYVGYLWSVCALLCYVRMTLSLASPFYVTIQADQGKRGSVNVHVESRAAISSRARKKTGEREVKNTSRHSCRLHAIHRARAGYRQEASRGPVGQDHVNFKVLNQLYYCAYLWLLCGNLITSGTRVVST